MAKLKSIRSRISSVKNTQQITRAMKMVAAAKLRRAQESLMKGRPYAIRLFETISHIASRVSQEAHPLLQPPQGSRTRVLLITSDRGLCGAFNANIQRRLEAFASQHRSSLDSLELVCIGRKGYDYFRRRAFPIPHYFRGVFDRLEIEQIIPIAQTLIQDFLDKKYDKLLILYNEFKSVASQNVVVEQLLPIVPKSSLSDESSGSDNYVYEPSQDKLLAYLLPLHIRTQIFRALRESFAAEMGARMSAMEAANKNAKEMIGKLTLAFNRARQAAITTELVEIISGASAL